MRSRLHRETTKTPVLPCLDVIEQMTQRIDHESRTILNFEDKHVTSYQALVLNQLYHFKGDQVKVTTEWFRNKIEFVDFLSIMKGWWSKGQFRASTSPTEWRTSKLRESIQIIVILLERTFRGRDASSFPKKQIPIIHQFITHGSTLNQREIISSNIYIHLKKPQKEHQFYMSS